VEFTTEQQDLLQILKSNVGVDWANSMVNQLREAAELESDLIKHIFKDPAAYLKNLVTVLIDETHGRDNLVFIVLEFNKRTPFLMLNDYRIAHVTNSLKRVEILK
jgi:hypothetical protein